MNKKIYSQKDDVWIKLPRSLYKCIARALDESQIAEFYLSYSNHINNPELTVQDIIAKMISFDNLINSETFLNDLNMYSDSEGNISWEELLGMYEE